MSFSYWLLCLYYVGMIVIGICSILKNAKFWVYSICMVGEGVINMQCNDRHKNYQKRLAPDSGCIQYMHGQRIIGRTTFWCTLCTWWPLQRNTRARQCLPDFDWTVHWGAESNSCFNVCFSSLWPVWRRLSCRFRYIQSQQYLWQSLHWSRHLTEAKFCSLLSADPLRSTRGPLRSTRVH